jgi:protein O-mannosyl-transferase
VHAATLYPAPTEDVPTNLAMTWLRKGLPWLAAALAMLAFLPALDADFVNWDDEVSFLANPHYRGLGPAQLRWMFTTTLLAHWSPLTWMTWGLNYVLGGLDPKGYHLANVLLHGANAALFYLVARRLLVSGFDATRNSPGTAAGAVFAALVFGLHPLRAESVAWVSERRDVLCAFFLLLAVLAYLRGVARGGSIGSRWWGLSLAAFAAALLSKASAMTLPLTLLVIDVYPLRRRSLGWRGLLIEKIPYALLAGVAALLAVLARQESGNITAYGRYGTGARVALASYTFWFYPWKFVWPTGLSPMYELPARVDPLEPRFLFPLIAVIVITAVLVALRRRWPAGLSAWTYSAIVLLPVSGLVHSGNQIAADRYSYLSGFGFAILAGAGLTWSLRRAQAGSGRPWLPHVVSATASLVVAALAVMAWTQTTSWRDSETLWRRAAMQDPVCSICESNLGRVIGRPGRFEEAEAHVRRAIELTPDRAGPHENMGFLMVAQRRFDAAEAEFRRAVASAPDRGQSWNGLGVALANQGQHRDAEAEAAFREAARLSPRLVDAPANLGLLYVRAGRYAEAIPSLRLALALDPSRMTVRAGLGRALRARAIQLMRQSDLEQGWQRWKEAASFSDDDPDSLRSLGRVLVEQGKSVEAIPSLERAVALAPRSDEARLWLVRAYRFAGRAADAEREAATLRELAPGLASQLGQ